MKSLIRRFVSFTPYLRPFSSFTLFSIITIYLSRLDSKVKCERIKSKLSIFILFNICQDPKNRENYKEKYSNGKWNPKRSSHPYPTPIDNTSQLQNQKCNEQKTIKTYTIVNYCFHVIIILNIQLKINILLDQVESSTHIHSLDFQVVEIIFFQSNH